MATERPVEVETRRDQMFATLTESEVARIRRFGNVQHCARGSCLFKARDRGPGMFVVPKGVAAIGQIGHDGPARNVFLFLGSEPETG
ncbi:hypothetical protein [Variovorax sp. PAMC 28711]|uniref:hypothetical protein n=1 Tax=Variovorax sp. PAMC 28711 TaxID=1795631 RepID=UPI0012E95693|nr:hypothetical protein [Variovorax sp. PAMC 28711]